jgi:hypothetical protein
MDPITIATITAGVSVLASECAKGIAGEAGKDIWAKIKSALGWTSEPKFSDLAPAVAAQLSADKQLAAKIVTLLQQKADSTSLAGVLVGKVDAEKVVIAHHIQVSGDFNM